MIDHLKDVKAQQFPKLLGSAYLQSESVYPQYAATVQASKAQQSEWRKMTRLYTEDVNRDTITSILDHYCEGYTLIPAIGAWKGHRESSLIIELFGTPSDIVERIAAEIATVNQQECVAVATFPTDISFVPALAEAVTA